jgi:hypothetical protein
MNRLQWIAVLSAAALLLEMSGPVSAQGRGGCGGMGRQAQMNGPSNAGFQGPYSTTFYGQQPAVLNTTPPVAGTSVYGTQPSGLSSYSTDPAANQVRDSLNTLMADLTSAVSNRELTFSQATQISQDVAYALRVGTTNRPAVARLQSDIKALPKYTKLAASNLKTITEDIQALVPATRPKDSGEAVAKDK